MAIKLTQDQQNALKKMVGFCEVFADQIYMIMKHHGLDGTSLRITVDPLYNFSTNVIHYGKNPDDDYGEISLSKGVYDHDYKPFGRNSAEYELLFADEAVRKAIQERLDREKPLPPDGLWVGASNNSDPVDGWEWDVNDSLS